MSYSYSVLCSQRKCEASYGKTNCKSHQRACHRISDFRLQNIACQLEKERHRSYLQMRIFSRRRLVISLGRRRNTQIEWRRQGGEFSTSKQVQKSLLNWIKLHCSGSTSHTSSRAMCPSLVQPVTHVTEISSTGKSWCPCAGVASSEQHRAAFHVSSWLTQQHSNSCSAVPALPPQHCSEHKLTDGKKLR